MEKAKLIDIENDFLEDEEAIFKPKAEPKDSAKPLTLDEQIVKKYKVGMTLKQITTEHGLSYGKVYEILNRLGVQLRHGRYNASKSGDRLLTMSSFEKASLVADYQSGLSMKELLDKYQINKHGCYSILDAHQVPRRNKHNTLGVDIERVANTHAKAMFTITPATPALTLHREGNTLFIKVKQSEMDGIEQVNFEIEEGK